MCTWTPPLITDPWSRDGLWQGCPLGTRYFFFFFPRTARVNRRWLALKRRRLALNRRQLANRRRLADDRLQLLAGWGSAEVPVHRRSAVFCFYSVLRTALVFGSIRAVHPLPSPALSPSAVRLVSPPRPHSIPLLHAVDSGVVSGGGGGVLRGAQARHLTKGQQERGRRGRGGGVLHACGCLCVCVSVCGTEGRGAWRRVSVSGYT